MHLFWHAAKAKGYIETHRLHEALQELGFKFERFEVNKMCQKYDEDNSGSIFFDEFSAMIRELNRKKYLKVFSNFDVDGSGQLDAVSDVVQTVTEDFMKERLTR